MSIDLNCSNISNMSTSHDGATVREHVASKIADCHKQIADLERLQKALPPEMLEFPIDDLYHLIWSPY